MPSTVLTGTSGALYYKPAGTLATLVPDDVSTTTNEITVDKYLGFRVGDPVKFSVVNQLGGTVSGTLPGGLTAGTTYYVTTFSSSGALKVSATLGGTAVTLTTAGTAASPNVFQAEYADFGIVAQVRDWSFEISRSEIDVTTIGQTPGEFAPFKTYITGFADGNGSANVYLTDEEVQMSNRMIKDVLRRKQVGASLKLYIDRVETTGGSISNTKSRSIEIEAVLTSASLNINPDDAVSVAINFRPSGSVAIDLNQD